MCNFHKDNKLPRRQAILVIGSVLLTLGSPLPAFSLENSVTVRTKKELKKALDSKIPEIIVEGRLAKEIYTRKETIGIRTEPAAFESRAIAVSASLPDPVSVSPPIEPWDSIITLLAIFFSGLIAIRVLFDDYKEVDFDPLHLKLRLIRREHPILAKTPSD